MFLVNNLSTFFYLIYLQLTVSGHSGLVGTLHAQIGVEKGLLSVRGNVTVLPQSMGETSVLEVRCKRNLAHLWNAQVILKIEIVLECS